MGGTTVFAPAWGASGGGDGGKETAGGRSAVEVPFAEPPNGAMPVEDAPGVPEDVSLEPEADELAGGTVPLSPGAGFVDPGEGSLNMSSSDLYPLGISTVSSLPNSPDRVKLTPRVGGCSRTDSDSNRTA